MVHGDILCDIDMAPHLNQGDFTSLILIKDRKISGYRGTVGVDKNGNIVQLGKFYESGLPSIETRIFYRIHFLSPFAHKSF